jgi:hypothetical protein
VSSVVHTAFGGVIGLGATAGVAAFVPAHDPSHPDRWDQKSWTEKSRVGMAALGTTMVLSTLGMQDGTAHRGTLGRGVNPIYFLGVGMAASSIFMTGKFQQAYEQ